MEKKIKPGRGGSRAGSGRKKNEAKGKEVKETVSIRMYPSQIKAIEASHKTIQLWIDGLL
jgi:hypothetical protein